MAINITFDVSSHDDREEVKELLKGPSALRALDEIREQIFRPMHKHGYHSDSPLYKHLNDSLPENDQEKTRDILSSVETEIHNILRDNDLLGDD